MGGLVLALFRPRMAGAATGIEKGSAMPAIIPDYIELKAGDIAATKTFYRDALGFSFTEYGPDYAAKEDSPCQIGFSAGDSPAAPLPAFRTDDLEATLAAVEAAGGTAHVPIFAFPEGRRFEFTDPAGNKIAIYQPG